MAKAKAKGSNKGSLGSMALGTTPKAKRSDSRTQTGEKPKRRQSTKHLQQYEFQAYGWAVFSKGNKAPNQYTTYELRQIVKRASKAANQRLRKLEAAGVDKWAYKSAQKALGDNRKRYWERTDKRSREELSFMYAKYMEEEFVKLIGSEIIYRLIIENRKEDLEYHYNGGQRDLHAEQHDEQLGGRILLEAVRRLNE